MSIDYRRLSHASLDAQVSDPSDRNTLPMSTLISSDEWLIEAPWDGMQIGDVDIFRNLSVGANGKRKVAPDGKPEPDDWVWWAAVPCGQVRCYKLFLADAPKSPATLDASRAERQKEPRQPAQSGKSAA